MKIKKIFLLIIFLSLLSACSVLKTTTKSEGNSTTTVPTTFTSAITTEKTTSKSDATTVTKDQVNKVYFMSINDTHGALQAEGYGMSLSMVEGITESLEEEAGQRYLRFQSGDLFQGSYVSKETDGRCMIEAMNAMNLDCMVLGNHEFDWGLDTIKIYWDNDESNGEANFPILGANLLDSKTNTCPDWVEPYTIIDYYNLQVGVIGIIGESLENTIAVTSLGSYYFDNSYSYVEKYAKELRNNGCDVVVLLTHDYTTSTFSYLASNLVKDSYIDAIFAGHTHQEVEEYYTRRDDYLIPTIQSYTKNGSIGTITLNLDSNNHAISGSFAHYSSASSIYKYSEESSAVNQVVAKYQAIIDEGNNTIVGYLGSDVYGKENIANLMDQAMMWKYEGDVAFVNSGGVRASSMKAGNVTKAMVTNAFPFDNYVVYVFMTGSNLKNYLNSRGDLLSNSDLNLSNISNTKVYKVMTCDYVSNASSQAIKLYSTDNMVHYEEEIMKDVLCEYLTYLMNK